MTDQTVSFPEVRTWDELFEETLPADDRRTGSLFCAVHLLGSYRPFRVLPSLRVHADIHQNMLQDYQDTKSIAAIQWSDGRVLVLARSGLIIASRWLAFIDAASIPDGAVG